MGLWGKGVESGAVLAYVRDFLNYLNSISSSIKVSFQLETSASYLAALLWLHTCTTPRDILLEESHPFR
jgi:hypothetical protein